MTLVPQPQWQFATHAKTTFIAEDIMQLEKSSRVLD